MFLDYPTVVQTNIFIRSMGPISELDMVSSVCVWKKKQQISVCSFFLISLGVLDGLLFSPILARSTSIIFRTDKVAFVVNKNVGTYLAARHILLQWKKLLRSHNNRTEQAVEDKPRRRHFIFNEVCKNQISDFIDTDSRARE